MIYSIVGDVHGCVGELEELHKEVSKIYGEKEVQWIFVGDLVDKGPESGMVCEFVRDINGICVMGNHEYKNIRFNKKCLEEENGGRKNKMNKTEELLKTRSQLRALNWDVYSWLAKLPDFHRIKDFRSSFVVLHGGLEPNKKPEEMGTAIYFVRRIKPDGQMARLEESRDDYPFWTNVYSGDETIFFGHAPVEHMRQTYIKDGLFCFGLDTGCVFGNKLTAAVLHHDQRDEWIVHFHDVRAKEIYKKNEMGWLKG